MIAGLYKMTGLAMDEKADRQNLQRRLEQTLRLAALASDDLTRERLTELAREIEEQLRLSE